MTDGQAQRVEHLLQAATGAVAIEAHWDGDTQGWFVCVDAVFESAAGHRTTGLASIRRGDDLRLFDGTVPPWPESEEAARLGGALAQRLGIPFHFPAPDWPEADCPHVWEVHQSVPCLACGVLLVQRHDLPWRGWCYHCHIAREAAARDAVCTTEELAAPRCVVCAAPMPVNRGSSDETFCWTCVVSRLRTRTTRAQRRYIVEQPFDFDNPVSRTTQIARLVGCSREQALSLLGAMISEADRATELRQPEEPGGCRPQG